MKVYKIICLETFESWLGTIKKGEELNIIHTCDSLLEAKRWAYNQYGPYGENIKHKVIEVVYEE